MSYHITAKLDFLALASLRACQTIDRCSQQPGIFSMQPFCIDLSINLLLCIRWASRGLETKLRKSLPSTFKRAIGQKSDSFVLGRTANFGDVNLLSPSSLNGNFAPFKTSLKSFEKKFAYFGTFFVNLVKYTI